MLSFFAKLAAAMPGRPRRDRLLQLANMPSFLDPDGSTRAAARRELIRIGITDFDQGGDLRVAVFMRDGDWVTHIGTRIGRKK